MLYDWRIVWPRIVRFRDQYIDHADEPEVANLAKEQFDREHHRSVMLLTLRLGLLLGLIVFSSNVSERRGPPVVLPGPQMSA